MATSSRLKGNKGKQKGSTTRTPDSLFSNDRMEIIMGLSEGPIGGLVDGLKSFMINDTPVLDIAGNANFKDVEITQYVGTELGETITPKLGGIGSQLAVNVLLDSNVPVVRQLTKPYIDYIDLRIAVQRLVATNDKGDYASSVEFSVEIKAASASTWVNPVIDGYAPGQSSGTGYSTVIENYPNPYASAGATAPSGIGAVWFQSGVPYLKTGNTWNPAPSIVTTANQQPGFTRRTWASGKQVAFIGTGTQPPYLTEYFSTTAPGQQSTPADTVFYWVKNQTVYEWNGSAWVEVIIVPSASGPRSVVISGKTTSGYVKELRLPVARIPEPYQIRVTKLSPVNTTTNFSDISVESVGEINIDPLIFPGLAVVDATMRASEQLSSSTELSGIYNGRLIKIPSNYNPVTKVYNGIWDGTFSVAVSANPAWVAYDIVSNARYGLNAYADVQLDKWSTYAFGRHCDTYGFTYNDYVQEPRSVEELIEYVCAVAGGRWVDFDNGYSTIIFDSPTDGATAIFAPENVQDGLFTYSFSDITTRKNDVTVSFINPDIGWVEDRRRVYDPADVTKFGRNPEEFIAVGCTNEPEAIRRARLRLVTGLTEKGLVSFRTNRQGLYVNPYDIILICDGVTASGLSGRVKTTSGQILELRDPIFLEPGFNYTISLQKVVAGKLAIETLPLGTARGLLTSLQLASAPTSAVAPETVFAINTTGGTGMPKAYRVTGIDEIDNDPDNVSVSAIEVNRTKWAYVAAGGVIEPVEYQPIRVNPQAPASIKVTPFQTSGGEQRLLIQWAATDTVQTGGYRLYIARDDQQDELVIDTRVNEYTLQNVDEVAYTFSVATLNLFQQESRSVSIGHNARGVGSGVPPVTGIRVKGGNGGIFSDLSPVIAWDASTHVFVDQYEVKILRATNSAVLQTFTINNTSFTYTIAENGADHGGAAERSFIVSVVALTARGGRSSPAQLLIQNPVPPVVTMTVVNDSTAAVVKITPSTEPDVKGYKIWASTVTGFTPSVATLVYEGPDPTSRILLSPGPWYIRAAAFDSFQGGALNVNAEATVTIASISTSPPLAPNTPTLTTSVIVASDGTLSANVTVSVVQPNTTPPTVRFAVEAAFAGQPYQLTYGDVSPITLRNLPLGQAMAVRVRAVSAEGFTSDPTPIVPITTASNVVAPVTPSDLTIVASFRSLFLSWSRPSAKDFSIMEVWEGTTSSFVSAVRIGTAGGETFVREGLTSGLTRYYWLRPVNTSGVPGAFSASPVAGTTQTISGVTDITPSTVGTTALIDGSITTAKIGAGQVVANSVAAGAITTDKLSVSSFGDNLIPNWNFLEGGTGWTDGSYLGGGTSFGPGYCSLTRIVGGASGNYAQIGSRLFPVQPEDTYEITVEAVGSSYSPVGLWCIVYWYDQNGTSIGSPTYGNFSVTSASWTISTQNVTSPAYARLARLYVLNNSDSSCALINLRGTSVRRLVGSTLIKDGAITTSKIISGAITTDKILAGAVTAGTIAAGAVTTDKLNAGAVTADKVAAGAITAGKIAAGSITTDKLAVGGGGNLLENTDLSQGLDAWQLQNAGYGGNPSLSTYTSGGTPQRAYRLEAPAGTPASAYLSYIYWGRGTAGITAVNAIPCKSGDTYELSVKLKCASTQVYLGMYMINAAGVATFNTTLFNPAVGSVPEDYSICTYRIKTPPGTVSVMPAALILTSASVSGTPAVELYKPIFCVCPDGATEATPWDRGGITQIGNGAILTDAINARTIAAGAITVDKLAANSVTANAIAAGSVTATKLSAGAVTAGTIAAGAITTDKLAAGAITTDKLSVGSFGDNLIPNWDFAEGLAGWSVTAPAGSGATISGTSVVLYRSPATSGGSAYSYIESRIVKVTAGDAYEVAFSVRGDATDPGVVAVGGIRFYDANGAYLGDVGPTNYGVTANWETKAVTAVAPNNSATARVWLYNYTGGTTANLYVRTASLRRAVGATLIKDGAITTDKIAVGAITADKISTASLSALTANLGAVTAGTMTSPNGKFLIDLNNGVIKWYDANNVLRGELGKLTP
jgi:predicted phage tail protein